MVALVKVCGFTQVADLDAALALGVDAIGLNLVASSPRVLQEPVAFALAERSTARVVWVVDDAPPPFFASLKAAFPGSIVQYTQGRGVGWNVVRSSERLPEGVLLVDAKGSLGGSGKTADWAFAAELSRGRQVILAGGLHVGNLAEAIALVRPYGVDVSSGIESATGKKDERLMAAFVRIARGRG